MIFVMLGLDLAGFLIDNHFHLISIV